ncbi:MAG: hypothetical protein K2X77_02420 [Candidatus Obscuribacterales bacterium]|nr:hypothetical protein [Candidatus Obscuribacterales bacterium]
MFKLPEQAILFEESHFNAKIRQCPNCSLKWFQIFTEFLNSKGDNQTFVFIPITDDDDVSIRQCKSESALISCISSIAKLRRYLVMHYPGEEASRVAWTSSDLHIGYHD